MRCCVKSCKNLYNRKNKKFSFHKFLIPSYSAAAAAKTLTRMPIDSSSEELNSKSQFSKPVKVTQIPSYQHFLTTNTTIKPCNFSQYNNPQEMRSQQSSTIPQAISLNRTNLTQLPNVEENIVNDMSKFYRKSPFIQRKIVSNPKYTESPRKESMFSSIGQSIMRNLTTSPFSQKRNPIQPNHMFDSTWKMANSHQTPILNRTDTDSSELIQHSTAMLQKRLDTPLTSSSNKPESQSLQCPIQRQGNQSPIVLQRFYHQQNQYRDKERFYSDGVINPFVNSYIPNYQTSEIPISANQSTPSTSSQSKSNSSHIDGSGYSSPGNTYIPINNLRSMRAPSSPINDCSNLSSSSFLVSPNSEAVKTYKLNETYASNRYFDLASTSSAMKENTIKDDHGAMKQQFASYVKSQSNPSYRVGEDMRTNHINRKSGPRNSGKSQLLVNRSDSVSSSADVTDPTVHVADHHHRLNKTTDGKQRCFVQPPNPHILTGGIDRKHRSPDPPPRYNRGQSPLLLRKNVFELSGQTTGSPLLNRRFNNTSPPLPPSRRGSESVPGSPQHFRTRIHYTPEPQRRIYRTIDQ